MTEIYHIQLLSRDQFDILKDELYKLLPKTSILKLHNYKNRNDFQRSIFGECIVRVILSEKLNCKPNQISFIFSENGKPSLPDNSWHFSISHSGNHILAVISPTLTGVDVEKKRTINLNIAKRYFHLQEYDLLLSRPEAEREDLFFQLWTLKESFIKAMGWGIANSLNRFSIIPENGKIHFSCNEINQNVYFKSFMINEIYYAAVCSIADPGIGKLQDFVFDRDFLKKVNG